MTTHFCVRVCPYCVRLSGRAGESENVQKNWEIICSFYPIVYYIYGLGLCVLVLFAVVVCRTFEITEII